MNDANRPRPPLNFAELLDKTAREAGKTTILQRTPSGGFIVWVTPREADPVTALMSAALSIMIARGQNPDSKSGISIRRMTGVIAPGCDVFWSVTDNTGVVIAEGYAKDESAAADEIAKHVKMRPAVKPANDGGLTDEDGRSGGDIIV